MWKEQMIKDIETIKFNPNKLFKNPNTNEFITRDEYINLVLDDFLEKKKEKIDSLGGLIELETLESNLGVLTALNPLECGEELAKSLLTYIYWKYKNPKSTRSIDITDVKKVIGLKIGVEKLINPIEFQTKCYMCDDNVIVLIPSYENNRIIFRCNNCNHFYETASGSNYGVNNYLGCEYIKCNCEYCNNIHNKIYTKGITWFDNLRNICDDLTQNSNEFIKIPNEKIMKQHHDIYFNNQNDKQIKEIISYNPKSLNELLNISESIANTHEDSCAYYNLLIQKLEKINFVYKIKKKKDIDVKTLMTHYILGVNHTNYRHFFNEFSKYIGNGEFVKFYSINTFRNDSNFSTEHGGTACRNFNIIDEIDIKQIEKYLYEDYSIINSYFIDNHTTKEHILKEINTLINNCSELDLKLILETSKAIISVAK